MAARFAAALLFLVPPAVAAQLVVGRVVDDRTDAPLPVTSVLLIDSLTTVIDSTLSDAHGRFFLHPPGRGVFRVHADHLGYNEVVSRSFLVHGNGSIEFELRLTPRAFELDPLVVTAEAQNAKLKRQGFYRRKTAGVAGHFFDADDIREQHALVLTDLLTLVPGVQVRTTAQGATVLLSQRMGNLLLRRPGGCPMKLVMDGFRRELLSNIDDLVDLALVAGIEVYPGAGGYGAPIQQRGPDAFCGIVMIWTR